MTHLIHYCCPPLCQTMRPAVSFYKYHAQIKALGRSPSRRRVKGRNEKKNQQGFPLGLKQCILCGGCAALISNVTTPISLVWEMLYGKRPPWNVLYIYFAPAVFLNIWVIKFNCCIIKLFNDSYRLFKKKKTAMRDIWFLPRWVEEIAEAGCNFMHYTHTHVKLGCNTIIAFLLLALPLCY